MTALNDALGSFRAGRFEQAIALCDTLLADLPDQIDALAMSGAALLAIEHDSEAEARLRRVLALDPGRTDSQSDLGLALYRLGLLEEAEMHLRAVLAQRPSFPQAMVNLGAVLREMDRNDEAVSVLNEAIRLTPSIAEAYYNLSLIEVEGGQPVAALELAERALSLKPQLAVAMHARAHALAVLGREAEALAQRHEIVALWPEDGKAHAGLALTQMHYGHLTDAAQSFRTALRHNPREGEWHRTLSVIVRHVDEDDDMRAMRKLESSNDVPASERMHLCFGLGKAYEDIGEFDRAFEYFARGNALRRERLHYSQSEIDALYDDIKRNFSAEFLAEHAGHGVQDGTPIFVLGMPRSGTTLVEQILAGHPDVCGAGEFTLLGRLVDRLRGAGPSQRLSQLMDLLTNEQITGIGKHYVERLRLYSSTARLITDKLPGNFLLIGLIHLALPDAKIIHVRRNPVDTCLSIYKNYFANESLRFAYDLSEIGHYYTRYLDLMEHWRSVLPGVTYDVSYEALVGDFDGEARRLIDHVGLDWRDGVRTFYGTSRPVQTASVAQVRRPIYATSIGQSSHVPPAALRTLQRALGH